MHRAIDDRASFPTYQACIGPLFSPPSPALRIHLPAGISGSFSPFSSLSIKFSSSSSPGQKRGGLRAGEGGKRGGDRALSKWPKGESFMAGGRVKKGGGEGRKRPLERRRRGRRRLVPHSLASDKWPGWKSPSPSPPSISDPTSSQKTCQPLPHPPLLLSPLISLFAIPILFLDPRSFLHLLPPLFHICGPPFPSLRPCSMSSPSFSLLNE